MAAADAILNVCTLTRRAHSVYRQSRVRHGDARLLWGRYTMWRVASVAPTSSCCRTSYSATLMRDLSSAVCRGNTGCDSTVWAQPVLDLFLRLGFRWLLSPLYMLAAAFFVLHCCKGTSGPRGETPHVCVQTYTGNRTRKTCQPGSITELLCIATGATDRPRTNTQNISTLLMKHVLAAHRWCTRADPVANVHATYPQQQNHNTPQGSESAAI